MQGVGEGGEKVRFAPEAQEAPVEKIYVKQTTVGDQHQWKVGIEKSGVFSGPWQKIKHSVRELFSKGGTTYAPLTRIASDSGFTQFDLASDTVRPDAGRYTHIDTALAREPSFLPLLKKAHREARLASFNAIRTPEGRETSFNTEYGFVNSKLKTCKTLLLARPRDSEAAARHRNNILNSVADLKEDIALLRRMAESFNDAEVTSARVEMLEAQVAELESEPAFPKSQLT